MLIFPPFFQHFHGQIPIFHGSKYTSPVPSGYD